MRILKNLLNLSKRKSRWTVEEIHTLIEAKRFSEALEAAHFLNELTPHVDLLRRCLMAEISFHKGEDDLAKEVYRAVLTDAPGFPEAHYGLSVLLLEEGDVEQALEHAQFAKLAKPHEVKFVAQLGLCFLRQGSYSAAEKLLKQAVKERPTDKFSWNNLGILLIAKAEPGEAQVCFKRALLIDPEFESARRNLGYLETDLADAGMRIRAVSELLNPAASNESAGPSFAARDPNYVSELKEALALAAQGQTEAALRTAEDLLAQSPDNASLAGAIAKFYCEHGDPHGGVELLRAFLVSHPSAPAALAALGSCYAAIGDDAAAIEAFNQALQSGHDSVQTQIELAGCLHKLERYEDALQHFRQVVDIAPTYDNQLRLAAALVSSCKYEEALAIYEDMTGRPEEEVRRGAYLSNFTHALIYSGHLVEAKKNLDEMLGHAPNDVNIRTTRAVIRLLYEDFEGGWQDYAYRGVSFSRHFRTLPVPKWRGESLEGKRIVVLAEQGLGDQVMFASCLPDLLLLQPEEVVVEVINRVAKTIERSFPQVKVIPSKQKNDLDWLKELGPVDYFAPLGDLPASFRNSVADFPRCAYLVADQERVSFWRRKLEEVAPRPWIGVSWRGGTQVTRKAARSMSVTDFSYFERPAGGSLICLQYGDVAEDLDAARAAGIAMHHWAEAITDLDEFSALISALDGVVTVCNTTVHYAGALGKPVWVLAPKVPEWRYGLMNEFMPWYPQARVLRQLRAGDWRQCLEAARDEFRHFWAAATASPVASDGVNCPRENRK